MFWAPTSSFNHGHHSFACVTSDNILAALSDHHARVVQQYLNAHQSPLAYSFFIFPGDVCSEYGLLQPPYYFSMMCTQSAISGPPHMKLSRYFVTTGTTD